MNENQEPKLVEAGTDDLISHFQSAWDSGQASAIEEFLATRNETASDEVMIRLIQQEIEWRRQRGESPSSAEYQERFPSVEAAAIVDVLMLPAPPPPEIKGPLLPKRYRPLREIGRGGIGSVWRVQDKTLDRPLAAKVLHERYRADKAANARLEREAFLTGTLQHPGIPPIHDRGKLLSGSAFFTMKLVEGETLAELIHRNGDLESQRPQLLSIFEQMAQTMAYAHSRKIIHRDLKPENTMVGEFGEVQIMDWGMAKVLNQKDPGPPTAKRDKCLDSPPELPPLPSDLPIRETKTQANDSSIANPLRTLTRQGDVFGTPAYMPPEQAQGDLDAMSERSDVFSLGAILLEMLTGQPLYDEVPTERLIPSVAAGKTERSLQRLRACGADQDLIGLCSDCLDVDQTRRPANGQEVADRIGKYLQSVEERLREAELSKSRADVKVAEERKRKWLANGLAVTVIATVIIALSAWIWYQNDQKQKRIQEQIARSETLVKAIGTAPIPALPFFAVNNLEDVREHAIPQLENQFQSSDDDQWDQKLRYALALAFLGDVKHRYLISQIPRVSTSDLSVLVNALGQDSDESAKQVLAEFVREEEVDTKAKLALVAINLGESSFLDDWFANPNQVDERMALIEHGGQWRGELDRLFAVVDSEHDPLVRYSILAAIAEIPATEIPATQIQEQQIETLVPRLNELFLECPQAEIRAAAELTLKRWQRSLPDYEIAKPDYQKLDQQEPEWYVNSIGMIMVRVPVKTFDKQTDSSERAYDVYVADREITRQLFYQFVQEDTETANRIGETGAHREGERFADIVLSYYLHGSKSQMKVRPVDSVGQFDARRFCNWLSRREGLEPYYIDNSSQQIKNTFSNSYRLETWDTNPNSTGYRLPEKMEFNSASFGHEVYYGGNTFAEADRRHHERFGWYLKNTFAVQPVALKLPNRHGLFDIAGNLSELGMDGDFYAFFGATYEDSKLTPGVEVEGSGIPTINYRKDAGFRVVRVDQGNVERFATTARMEPGQQALEQAKQFANSAVESRQPWLKFKLAGRIGSVAHELKNDHLEIKLDVYALAKRIYSELIRMNFRKVESLTFRGGNDVNSAIALTDLGRLDEAEEALQSAEKDLRQAIMIDRTQAEIALRFLKNHRLVLARLQMEQAEQMATHWEPQKRNVQKAFELAGKGTAVLGENSSSASSILAAIHAADGDFEKAIKLQEKAIRLIRGKQNLAAYQYRLRLYKDSKPYIRKKPLNND